MLRRPLAFALAIALLALIAVLPEYAVDLYYAYRSGSDPSYLHFAAANMTGSNRLLLGFGWPLVVVVAFVVERALCGLRENQQLRRVRGPVLDGRQGCGEPERVGDQLDIRVMLSRYRERAHHGRGSRQPRAGPVDQAAKQRVVRGEDALQGLEVGAHLLW